MPMTPKATTNDTKGAISAASAARTSRYDCVPVTAPAGSAALTAAALTPTSPAVAAARNRYSICALGCVPGGRSLAISAGSTQPSADWVTEAAKPTTVSVGVPGTPVTVTVAPSEMNWAPPGQVLPSTIWPGCRGQ